MSVPFRRMHAGKISPVLTLDGRPARLKHSLSANADGKTIYFTQYDRQSVIKMEFKRYTASQATVCVHVRRPLTHRVIQFIALGKAIWKRAGVADLLPSTSRTFQGS